jgi:cytochrome c biogenesis protein CcmG, thiol:disulfide interchange protein DsbE
VRRVLVSSSVVAMLGALFVFGLLRGTRTATSRRTCSAAACRPSNSRVYERYAAAYGPFLAVEEYVGKPMIINFWASWCGPCYEEAPHLERVWQRYADDILIVGIQTQDREARAAGRAFIDQFDLSFPNVIDNDSRVSIAYGLFGVPETFFVAADGTVVHKHAGPVTEAMMVERIEALLR